MHNNNFRYIDSFWSEKLYPERIAAPAPRPVWRAVALAALVLALVVGAPGTKAYGSTEQSPQVLVETTTDRMLTALKSEQGVLKQNPDRVYALVEEIVLPHFDLRRMSAWALGKYWRRASDDQKERFPEQFRMLLLRTYATALTEYTDEKIVYLPLRDDPASGDVIVRTEIQRASGPAIPVAYRLHNKSGDWKVYDIMIDGISLLANYRSSFASEIRRGGLEQLIARLAARNQKLASAE